VASAPRHENGNWLVRNSGLKRHFGAKSVGPSTPSRHWSDVNLRNECGVVANWCDDEAIRPIAPGENPLRKTGNWPANSLSVIREILAAPTSSKPAGRGVYQSARRIASNLAANGPRLASPSCAIGLCFSCAKEPITTGRPLDPLGGYDDPFTPARPDTPDPPRDY